MPPVTKLRASLRHLPFYRTLEVAEPSSDVWRATAAGLHVLHLVDSWSRTARRRSRIDLKHLHAVAESVRIAPKPFRELLSEVVAAIGLRDTETEIVVASKLFEYARQLHLGARWELAADVCETIVDRLGNRIDDDLLLRTMGQHGWSLRVAGHLSESEATYLELGRRAKRFGNREHVLRSRIGLANVLIERGNFPRAESLLEGVLSRARPARDASHRRVLSRALHARAVVALCRGRHEEGVTGAYQSLDICDEPIERESILNDIGAGFIHLRQLDAAQDTMLLLQATANNRAIRLMASINLMEIAALQGNATSFEARLLHVATLPMPLTMRAQYLYLAGEGFERLGVHQRAMEMYESSVAVAEASGVNEVIIKGESRLRGVRAGKILPPAGVAGRASADVERVIGAVAELRALTGVES